MKTLGIFIATPGRKSLWRTLQSIGYQNAPVEDILVVGDGYHEPTRDLVELAAIVLGVPCRYVATEQTRDWGHTQQNYALQHVRGDYLIYQDDDDIFLPRALTEAAALADAQRDPRPIIGRVKTPAQGLLWQTHVPTKAILDGHCLVVPNDKERLGWFIPGYNGDQCYIHTTLRNYKEHAWTDRIWTLTRPQWKLWPQWSGQGRWSWCCDLHRDYGGVPNDRPLVTVLLEFEEGTDRAMVTLCRVGDGAPSGGEWLEIVEFARYACQGKDCWINTAPDQVVLHDALEALNFKLHLRTEKRMEFTHDWPPEPATKATHLLDQNGNPVMDWRDEGWGGRAVT